MKIFLLSTSKILLKFFYILYLGIEMWIRYESFPIIHSSLGTKLRESFSEKFHHPSTIDWIYKHRNIKFYIPIDKGGEPISLQYIRVCIGKNSTNIRISNLELGSINSHHCWCNSIFYESK